MDDESSHFPEDIAELIAAIDTITITSADAERGFSTMNIICTPLRNRLGVERLLNLIFVSLVGPSLDYFNVLPYVNKNLAIANRSRVSCAHNTLRASMMHKYYTVTLKSRLSVTQCHWKRNHWIDHTRLSSCRVI